jgi:hypothetical protein
MMKKKVKALVVGAVAALFTVGGVGAASAINVRAVSDSAAANSMLIKTDASGVVPTDQNLTIARNVTRKIAESDDPRKAFTQLTPTEQRLFKAYTFQAQVVEDAPAPATPVDAVARASFASQPESALVVSRAVDRQAFVARRGVPTNGCWSIPGGLTGSNVFGGGLWRISHVHRLCVTNGRVTKATYQSTSGQALMIGWRWVKLDAKATGVVKGQSRQYVQHKFALGLNGWDVQVVDPCSRSAGTASGDVIPSQACNIALG